MSSAIDCRSRFTLSAAFVVALVLVSPPAMRAAQEAAPRGLCYAFGPENGERVVIPLESTEIVLDVKPGLMEAEVIQTFTNRTGTALEATYLYPLPADATLIDFELRYQDRVVRSIVREKGEARAQYETAKAEGKRTALLEQHDPSLFSTAVANFLPGETVHVVIRFIAPLDLTSEAIDVRFPMVTGDKYFPAEARNELSGDAAPNPSRLPDDVIVQDHVYAFDVQISGFPASLITSPSHRIRVETAGGSDRKFVSLEDEITIPDRDFVLRIATQSAERLQPTLVTQRTRTGDYGLLTVFPPRTRDARTEAVRPRDVLFLLDRSGSMSGKRFQSAQLGLERCIDALSPADRFQIVIFDDQFEFYQPSWVQGGARAFREARDYVRGLRVRGGTEMQPALAASLAAFERNDRQHILIFLTDGEVGNAGSLLNLIENRIGQVRLFTFGIGAAPNAVLIKKMAELGRGQARFLADDDEIDRELAELFATLDAPVLSNVRLSLFDAQGAPIEHLQFPERLPDVFAGRPIQTVFRTTSGPPAAISIEGIEGDRPVSHRLALQSTPLRGGGLETLFGSRLFADTGVMLRRAQTEEERALIRQEMLETALQFQLVTELTSRVAIDQPVARDPSAALSSQHVGQYRPADQMSLLMTGGPDDAGVVILSAFTVQTDHDNGYLATSTLAGTRTSTSLRDLATSVQVITKQLLDDVAPTALDDVVPFAMEPQYHPVVARQGKDAGLLDGLPIATVIDPATVNQITLQSIGPASSEIRQERAARFTRTTATARVGDEGYTAASVKFASDALGRGNLPVLAILSWSEFDHAQASVFLDARKTVGNTSVRGNVQGRDLDGYGAMRLVRFSVDHAFNDSLHLEAIAAWHELERDDPLQFRLAGPDARYDGLGFFNLDLLTAASRRLEDTIAQLKLSGKARRTTTTHAWSARTAWHRQTSDWITPIEGDAIAPQRDNLRFDVDYRLELAGGRLAFDTHLGWAQHDTPGETIRRQQTQGAALGFNWAWRDEFRVFGNWGHDEMLPWAPTGAWSASGAGFQALSHRPERREGGQFGLRADAWRGRVSGSISVFHENVSQHAYRDWAWERANGANESVVLPDFGLRAPISTQVWDRFTREGWMGSFSFNPTPAFTTQLTWCHDWANEGPYRGGNRRASLISRYEFGGGRLKGFSTGFGLGYRNDLTFNDGYTLGGGMRWDLMFGYRLRHGGGRTTLLQLNLINLTDASWQPTRFADDRGRQVLLSLTYGF